MTPNPNTPEVNSIGASNHALASLDYPEHDFVPVGNGTCLRCGGSHEWICPTCGSHFANDGGEVLTRSTECLHADMPVFLIALRTKR
jgi:predicted amidophosphoribosyltransferase